MDQKGTLIFGMKIGDEYTYSMTWWGYVYHAGKNGTWVNAADPPGNQGNITGN
jgi:hypothetical protein